METQAAAAIVAAYNALQPATITYGEAIEPATFRQCFSSYPFVDDQLVPTLQAVNAVTGATIVTLGDVSQHAETLGFNGGTAADPNAPSPTTLQQETTWLSADWPYWFRHQLETDYGGVAIEMAGSVGSNETPQVFPTAVSRTPQQFVDASHPAGCRTEFTADQSTAVPLGYYTEDVALGTQLAAAVHTALAAGTRVDDVGHQWGARQRLRPGDQRPLRRRRAGRRLRAAARVRRSQLHAAGTGAPDRERHRDVHPE